MDPSWPSCIGESRQLPAANSAPRLIDRRSLLGHNRVVQESRIKTTMASISRRIVQNENVYPYLSNDAVSHIIFLQSVRDAETRQVASVPSLKLQFHFREEPIPRDSSMHRLDTHRLKRQRRHNYEVSSREE